MTHPEATRLEATSARTGDVVLLEHRHLCLADMSIDEIRLRAG